MYADLVGASGCRESLDEGGVGKGFKDAIVCFGGANGSSDAFSVEGYRLPIASPGARYRCFDDAVARRWYAGDECEVVFLYFSLFEEAFEGGEGSFRASDDEEAARILVETMDDSRSQRVAHKSYLGKASNGPVDERA